MGDSSHCIADPKWEEEHKAEHDAGNHVLIWNSDGNEHWAECVYPGCTYEKDRGKHVPDNIWRAKEGGWGDKPGTETCSCKACKRPDVVSRTVTGKRAFFEESPHSACIGNGERYYFTFDLKVVDSTGKEIKWDGGYVKVAELPKGETWPEDPRSLLVYPLSNIYIISSVSSASSKDSINGKKNGHARTKEVGTFRLVFSNGLEGEDAYAVYSDEFKVTWSDHHIHTFDYKRGTWKTSPNPAMIKDDGKDPDGYCHWQVCGCGVWWGIEDCTPVIISTNGDCQNPGTTTYMCSKCGRQWTEKNAATGAHVPTGVQKDDDHRDKDGHYDICKLCGEVLKEYPHNYKVLFTHKTCTEETKYYQCQDCGLGKAEKTALKTPNHDYTSPPVYIDGVYHERVCKKCGYVLKEKHEYLKDMHFTCDCGAVEGYPIACTLSGDLCPHGTAKLTLDSSMDPAMYEIGWTRGGHTYGPSDTWNFSDNDSGANYTVDVYAYYIDQQIVSPRTDGSVRSIVWSIPFHVYSYMDVKGYPADCVTDGVKDHRLCMGCGKMVDSKGNVLSSVKIPMTGHTYDNDCDRSCNVCGAMREAQHSWSTEYYSDSQQHWHECTKCGANGQMSDHHIIAAQISKPASCESDGLYVGKCSICGLTVSNTLPATGHMLRNFSREATCINEGWKTHFGCVSCRLCYSDDTASTQVSAAEYALPIDPNNHVGGDMHHNRTSHWIKCQCGEKLDMEDHVFDENYLCTVCGYQGTAPSFRGLIKWLIIGGIILILLILLIILLLLRKKKKKEEETPPEGTDPGNEEGTDREPSDVTKEPEDPVVSGTEESADEPETGEAPAAPEPPAGDPAGIPEQEQA